MTEFVKSAFLNLAHTFPGQLQIRANFSERFRISIREAKSTFDYQTFFVIQLFEKQIELFFKRLPNQGLIQGGQTFIGKNIFQLQIRIACDRSVEGNLRRWSLDHLFDVRLRHPEFTGDFLNTGLVSQFLSKARDFRLKLIQLMLELRRQMKNLAVTCNGRQNRLANPPARVSHKPYATFRIKARSGFDEAHVPFIDQLMHGESRSGILL